MLLFVTRLANGDKLPRARVRIVDGEREVWPVAQVLDVVDNRPASVAAARLAELALAPVKLEDFLSHAVLAVPLAPVVKEVLVPGGDQRAQLLEPRR